MAGLQSCLRKGIVLNNLRILHRNALSQQTLRKKRLFSTVISKNSHFYKKSTNCCSINLTNLYRYSSSETAFNTSSIGVTDNKVDSSAPLHNAEASFKTPINDNVTVAEVTESNIVIDESLLPPRPIAPVENFNIVEAISLEAENVGTILQEPSFESLGLNSYWPVGWIHRCFEFLHITCDLPWWAAIGIVTLSLRLLTFPFNIKARINSVNMHNNMPEVQRLQLKINEARQTGNYHDTALYLQELQSFLKEKNIATMGSLLPMLVQTPIFLSMFWGLRKMTNLPVESMKTGGCFWFTDLTVADPYYILPFVIAGTMALIIETGAEGSSTASLNIWVKYAFRAMPWILVPFILNFPAAIQGYWVISNSFALTQILILKIPVIRNYLNIPVMIKHDKNNLPLTKNKKKGLGELRESITNFKLIYEIQDRERLNTVTFEKAGSGPVPRTFKQDPRKIHNIIKK